MNNEDVINVDHLMYIVPETINMLDSTKLTSKHIIFVTVDTKMMPQTEVKSYLAKIATEFKQVVAPAQVMVLSNRVSIEVMEIPDYVE